MKGKKLGIVFFALGVILMHAILTVNFWLIVLGIIPEKTLFGIIPAMSSLGSVAWGLGPPIGAVLMVIGGLIYGRKA